jgi:hypothetical protein
MSATLAPVWGRDSTDELGISALEDAFAAPTLEQYERARATDRDLVNRVIGRLGPLLADRVLRMSEGELAVLARLERAAT